MFQSYWIDGFGRTVLLRKKAIAEVLAWLNTVIRSDTDFYSNNGKAEIYNLFFQINNIMNFNPENTPHHFIHNDDSCMHLPIPVYSYIRPNMGTQFLLHILLSLGHFSTELDLIQQDSL